MNPKPLSDLVEAVNFWRKKKKTAEDKLTVVGLGPSTSKGTNSLALVVVGISFAIVDRGWDPRDFNIAWCYLTREAAPRIPFSGTRWGTGPGAGQERTVRKEALQG